MKDSSPINAKTLLQFPIFQGLSEKKLNDYLSKSPYSFRSYPSGNMIFFQETRCDFLNLLISGEVKALMMNNEGKQIIIENMAAPRVIAPAAVFASYNIYPVNIQAAKDCEILFLDKISFENLMHKETVIMRNFIKTLSDKSIFLSKKINTFALQSLKGRLASYLLNDDSHHTQQELSEILGVTRPSLARVMAELTDKGCIKVENRRIVILDKSLLKTFI